jgi:ubiquinone/menaquinone biosynthesis C-methylase UbiE
VWLNSESFVSVPKMPTTLAASLRDRFYENDTHPYRLFEGRVSSLLTHSGIALLDAGCGRTVPVLRRFVGKAGRLIGVELVDFTDVPDGIETYKADLAEIPLPDACVDVVMSRSVFEHLTDPEPVYREFARILKPGGRVIFLTANGWDYGSLVARLVPNRHHARVVNFVEGRAEEDTFPTAYKTNTRGAVARLAGQSGLSIASFEYLGQYPNYLMFNGVLFFLGMCYEKLIARFDALRFLRGWIMVTLEKPSAP